MMYPGKEITSLLFVFTGALLVFMLLRHRIHQLSTGRIPIFGVVSPCLLTGAPSEIRNLNVNIISSIIYKNLAKEFIYLS